jgi:hypothetical protein
MQRQRFYINYRKGISHFLTIGANSDIPSFHSIAQWEENPSSKIQALVRLLAFLLERDDNPPPTCTKEGTIQWPAPNSGNNMSTTRKRKILVYQEFSSMAGMLIQVCRTFSSIFSSSDETVGSCTA